MRAHQDALFAGGNVDEFVLENLCYNKIFLFRNFLMLSTTKIRRPRRLIMSPICLELAQLNVACRSLT